MANHLTFWSLMMMGMMMKLYSFKCSCCSLFWRPKLGTSGISEVVSVNCSIRTQMRGLAWHKQLLLNSIQEENTHFSSLWLRRGPLNVKLTMYWFASLTFFHFLCLSSNPWAGYSQVCLHCILCSDKSGTTKHSDDWWHITYLFACKQI